MAGTMCRVVGESEISRRSYGFPGQLLLREQDRVREGDRLQSQNHRSRSVNRTIALVAAALIGAAALTGCGIVAEVDREVYALGEEGETTLQNFTDATVFLPGCAAFGFEKLVEGTWQLAGDPFVCIWEGLAVPVEAGESAAFAFSPPSSGSWRLRYSVGLACDPEAPLSDAACEVTLPIRTPAFDVVTPHPSPYKTDGTKHHLGRTRTTPGGTTPRALSPARA